MFRVRSADQLKAANGRSSALLAALLDPPASAAIFAPKFPRAATATLLAALGKVPRPPAPAPACPPIDGIYQLVAGGRKACSRMGNSSKQGKKRGARRHCSAALPIAASLLTSDRGRHCVLFSPPRAEYLVYYGGNEELCANSVGFERLPGQFKPQRSRWELRVNSKSNPTRNVTVSAAALRIGAERSLARGRFLRAAGLIHCGADAAAHACAQAGRECPHGENGLAGHNAPANASVFLAGKSHRWRVAHVHGECTLVNFIDAVSSWRGVDGCRVGARRRRPLHNHNILARCASCADPRARRRPRLPELPPPLRRREAHPGVQGLRHRAAALADRQARQVSVFRNPFRNMFEATISPSLPPYFCSPHPSP